MERVKKKKSEVMGESEVNGGMRKLKETDSIQLKFHSDRTILGSLVTLRQ